ncbi:MAG: type II secretion system F family protein [Coriobacteriales bacterium]|jgi:type IV pilus assembly protein PilC|nr:type II secretion system F family protein [Coriobacteriales bacterium]
MPLYKYSAVTLDGSVRSGNVEAATVDALAAALRQEDLYLTKWTAAEPKKENYRLKTIELADFCRQLGAMLSAGIMLIRAMNILTQRVLKPPIKKIYDALIADLQRGSTLSEAMANRGRAFPELLINMIRAGENTGRLDATCEKMAVTYDKEHRLDSKLQQAFIYPIILIVLVIGVVIALFTFVLPQFMGLFEGMELPLPTKIVMGISEFLTTQGLWFLAAVVIVVVGLVTFFRQPRPRRALDHFKLRVPKIGHLLRTIYTARFARTLSSLYVSGISMIQALTIARGTIGNKYIEAQFDDVLRALGNGQSLSVALGTVDGFEPKLRSTILIGEESGNLEKMLESIADQYEYDSEVASQRLVTLVEPILIVVMAVIVAFVIISVLLPVFQMYSSFGTQEGI